MINYIYSFLHIHNYTGTIKVVCVQYMIASYSLYTHKTWLTARAHVGVTHAPTGSNANPLLFSTAKDLNIYQFIILLAIL